MSIPLTAKMGEITMDDAATQYERTPFGKEMKKHFLIDPSYRNLNHGFSPIPLWNQFLTSKQGSFGTFPRAIRDKQREFLDLCESAPDRFIRYTYPKLLDESRAAVAKVLNAPVESVVYVPNATSGVNTVNLIFRERDSHFRLFTSYLHLRCGTV